MKRPATLFSLNSNTSKEKTSFFAEFRKNRMEVSPSNAVIMNILNYSKALAVLKTHDSTIRLVMN